MPIYAYKCTNCGYEKDILQKYSDAPKTICPKCGQPTFKKQLSAPGFELKGTGWYATDFKGGSSRAQAASHESETEKAESKNKGALVKVDNPKAESKTESKSTPEKADK
ncbi:MAG: zinc ribbon domain-containing protein [Burkholderiales bacterium]|nr:zinc ribbon domain-containing protein [Burkholderiales bacterium]